MAALTTNIQGGRDDRIRPNRVAIQVVNGATVYEGGFTAVRDAGNATAANQGQLAPYDGAEGSLFIGEHLPIQDPNVSETSGDYTFDGAVTGDTTVANPPRAGEDIDWRHLININVTGASSIADQWKPVFLEDDNTLTLTPQTRPEAVGVISRYISGTACDVILTPLFARIGQISIERLYVTAAAVDMTQTSATLLANYPMPFKGAVLGVGYQAVVALTGAPTTTINADIGGTDVTDGTVDLAVTAINEVVEYTTFATAGQYFSKGSLLSLEIGAGTAPGAGTALLFVDVLRLPGT